MSSLVLDLLTPSGIAFEGEVSYISVPSKKGILGIMPGYTTLIAPLADKGVLKVVLPSKEERFFAVSFGALEVKREKTIILTEKAVAAADEASAKELLKHPPFTVIKDLDKDIKNAEIKLKQSFKE